MHAANLGKRCGQSLVYPHHEDPPVGAVGIETRKAATSVGGHVQWTHRNNKMAHGSRERPWLCPALAGGVGVALIAAGLWLYLPRPSVGKQCAGEVGAKSALSSTQTAIIFNNKTAAPIKIFWLDRQGVRKFYHELAPGVDYRQETYVNHIWAPSLRTLRPRPRQSPRRSVNRPILPCGKAAKNTPPKS